MVDACDAERPAVDMEAVAGLEAEGRGCVVAEERRVACSAPAADDHQPPKRKLRAVEAEDEERASSLDVPDPEVDVRRLRDAMALGDVAFERRGQQRPGQVRDVALEQAEIGAADVDQVVRGPVDAGGDREQRDDQPDPDRDAG